MWGEEVSQSKTRFGRFKAFWLELTELAAEKGCMLEPAVKVAERIGGVLGKARAETDHKQGPAPDSP